MILFLLVLPYSGTSFASGVLDENLLSGEESNPPTNYYSLNFVSTRELKDRMLAIFSSSPYLPTLSQIVEIDRMNAVLERFYLAFFEEYSKKPAQKTINYFAKNFTDYINDSVRQNSASLSEDEINRLYAIIYDILAPKNNSCTKYLNK